jgi:hypothetical protein
MDLAVEPSSNGNGKSINDWADWWRDQIGANVIPANTRKKVTYESWSEWQNKPISEELHNEWKKTGAFSQGIAVILGRVWHNEQKLKLGLYLNGIDADNLKAIEEICTSDGKEIISLKQLADWTLVEQHGDDTNKAHIYIYSHRPFAKKSSDRRTGINNNDNGISLLSKKLDNNEIPAIEVKGKGQDGIFFCTSSKHKNGSHYEIIGDAKEPVIADDFEQHIDNICRKYGIKYLEKADGLTLARAAEIRKRIVDNMPILEGERHDVLLSYTDSLLFEHLSKKSEEEIKNILIEVNARLCKPPLKQSEIDTIWNSCLNWVKDKKQRQEEEEGSQRQQTRFVGFFPTNDKTAVNREEEQLATENKLTTEDIDFVINTIKKEAQYDELSIRQLFCGMASAFTKDPISHIVNSKESGAGKSYLLNLVSSYFPNKYVIVLSGMSAKALFHRRGVLVIQNKETGELEPIAPMIEPLESEIDDIENKVIDEMDKEPPKSRDKKQIKNWKKRIRELESQTKDIESCAEKLIELDNQIILCLDTPEPSVYDALMSIISQDTERDQQYSFVDKSGTSGKLGTKDNILRGTPVLFTSQVIDDTKTLRFAEKNRRFININPDTSNKKIRAANNIIGLKHGFLPEEYDNLVVSRADKERARRIVKIMIAKLKQHTKHLGPKEAAVKIPFALSITSSIPDGHVWSMTVTDRTIKYLAIITKMNMDSRPKLVNEQTGQFYPIATFDDLKETLKLMQVGASGVRPYIVNWYNKVFVPTIKDLDGKPYAEIKTDDDDDKPTSGVDGKPIVIAKEKHIGVNTEQLALKTKEVFKGAKPSSKELRDKYLEPLVNLGVLDKVQSEIDRRENIYVPVEEGNLFHVFDDDNNNLRIKVSSPELFPSKNFLKEQFRTFVKKNAGDMVVLEKNFSPYKLVDVDGQTKISLDQLVDRYFATPDDCFAQNEDKQQ